VLAQGFFVVVFWAAQAAHWPPALMQQSFFAVPDEQHAAAHALQAEQEVRLPSAAMATPAARMSGNSFMVDGWIVCTKK